jgi:hypothetical protein
MASDHSDDNRFRLIGAVPCPCPYDVVSTFDECVLSKIGQLVHFQTNYGHGWIGTGEWNNVPKPFDARVKRFYRWRGNIRGGIGIVECPGHQLDSLWVAFATRHIGTFDFRERIAHCNVALFTIEPADPVDNGTFWVLKPDLPGFKMGGFAEIRENDSASS